MGAKHVDEAGSGLAALKKIQASPYTLIISDWNMEPMNGLDLLKEVRRHSKPGQNRFLFSTSERSWGHQTSAKIEGASGFITKPFTVDTLRTKVEAVLR